MPTIDSELERLTELKKKVGGQEHCTPAILGNRILRDKHQNTRRNKYPTTLSIRCASNGQMKQIRNEFTRITNEVGNPTIAIDIITDWLRHLDSPRIQRRLNH